MNRKEGYSFWNKNALGYGTKEDEIKELKTRIEKLEKRVKELENVDYSKEIDIFGMDPNDP